MDQARSIITEAVSLIGALNFNGIQVNADNTFLVRDCKYLLNNWTIAGAVRCLIRITNNNSGFMYSEQIYYRPVVVDAMKCLTANNIPPN